ncbi:hypothetical protein TNCV_2440211 [Trichonephila clavipes]|nr:hypothetical protein TNCV_2440211 [Trichonephila clavipes]
MGARDQPRITCLASPPGISLIPAEKTTAYMATQGAWEKAVWYFVGVNDQTDDWLQQDIIRESSDCVLPIVLCPLPSTNKNYNHILSIIDAFTKFAWLYPVKSTSSRDALGKLKQQDIIHICYTRAFGDGLRSFEPCSSDVDDNGALTPSPNYPTTPVGGHLSSRQIQCRSLPNRQVFSGTVWARTRHKTSHYPMP